MAFQFFRKHQKLILYTAGIFALVSFSITGAIFAFFDPSSASMFKPARMTLPGGRVVEVTWEDHNVGQAMINAASQPSIVLPYIATGSDNEGLRDRYAALRRLAIEFGIDASDDEVDRAITQALKMFKKNPAIQTPTQLARALQYRSLAAYRTVLREAMRIGTFLRVQVMAADVLDPALAQSVLDDEEMMTLRVASLDKKKIDDRLKENGVSDADLEQWVKDLDEAEQLRYRTPTNRVSLRAIGVRYEEFDPAEWAEELSGLEFDDEKLRQEYEFRKETYFRREVPQLPTPGNEEAAANEGAAGNKEEAGGEGKAGGEENQAAKLPQGSSKGSGGDGSTPQQAGETPPAGAANVAGEQPPAGAANVAGEQPPAGAANVAGEQPPAGAANAAGEQPPAGVANVAGEQPPAGAANAAGETPQSGGAEAGKPTVEAPAQAAPPAPYRPFEEVKDELARMLRAEAALDALRNGVIQDRLAEHMHGQIEARNTVSRELSAARKVLTEAEAAVEGDAGDEEKTAAVEAAQAEVEAKEAAHEAAEEALNVRRTAFDFVGQLSELIKDRKGVKLPTSIETPTDNDGLKDLGGLGTWDNTWSATSMSADGDISTQIQKTNVGCFHFQVPEVVERPLKPLEDIKEEAQGAYFSEQADEIAEASSEKFKAALLELAKAKIPDEIGTIEQDAAEELDKEFTEWEAQVSADLADAKSKLAERAGAERSMVYRTWDARRAELQEQLDKQGEWREEKQKESKEAVEEAIEEAARKVYKDVLEAALVETEFVVETLASCSVNVSTQPRFDDRYADNVKFLFKDPQASVIIKELQPGDATDILDDKTGRALYLAVCEARDQAVLGDLSRRQILKARAAFQRERMQQTLQQSFTLDALKARWKYESATALDEDPVAKPTTPESAPSDPKEAEANK